MSKEMVACPVCFLPWGACAHTAKSSPPTDIVQRLRDKAKKLEPADMHKEPIFSEAAAEIERLREDNQRLNALIDGAYT